MASGRIKGFWRSDHLARNRLRSFGDRRRLTWQLTRCLVPRLGNHSPQGRQRGWRGHGAGWSGTPVSGRTPMSGAFVSGCASAAARSPASRSTRGVRSGTSRLAGASRSAGVTGAVRWSRASCIAGVRGSMVWTTTSSSRSAVAAARRSASTSVCRVLVMPLSGIDGSNQARRAARSQEAARHAVDRALRCAGDELMDRRLSARAGPACAGRASQGRARRGAGPRRSAAAPP